MAETTLENKEQTLVSDKTQESKKMPPHRNTLMMRGANWWAE